MKRLILYLLAVIAAGALLFGWGYRRGAASVEVVESVRTVAVFYEKPEPVRVSHTSAAVRVPVLLFAPADTVRFLSDDSKPSAPADTVRETVVVRIGQDSAELHIALERQEYGGRDTTFYAVVSGPAVGGFRPRLERLELYAAERLRTTIVHEPPRWEIGPAAGAWYAPAGGSRSASAGSRSASAGSRSAPFGSGLWVGGYARRSFGRFHLAAAAGYDIRNGGAYAQVQTGMAVWRK